MYSMTLSVIGQGRTLEMLTEEPGERWTFEELASPPQSHYLRNVPANLDISYGPYTMSGGK